MDTNHLTVPRRHERRLPSSTDGRFSFTILDEKNKESDGFDETSSSDNDGEQVQFSKSCYISKCSSPNIPHLNYSVSQPSRMSAATSASRFKIVPVESRYKRGRWQAFDHYSADEPRDLKRQILCGQLKDRPSAHTIGSVPLTHPKRVHLMSQTEDRAPLATPEGMSSRSLASDVEDSDRESSVLSMRANPTTIKVHEPEESSQSTPAVTSELLNADVTPSMTGSSELLPTNLSGRITPSEMLYQYGLEKSLSATSYEPSAPKHSHTHHISPPPLNAPAASASAANLQQAGQPGSAAGVAIDSKIEQAMDLVKTHLMFAVREEVEHLRSRIMELETTVVHLEAENSILREHVPADVLQSLSIQTHGNQMQQAGLATMG